MPTGIETTKGHRPRSVVPSCTTTRQPLTRTDLMIQSYSLAEVLDADPEPHLASPCPICKAEVGHACRKKNGERLGTWFSRGRMMGSPTEHFMRPGGRGVRP